MYITGLIVVNEFVKVPGSFSGQVTNCLSKKAALALLVYTVCIV